MKKKLFSLLLVAVFAVSTLTGCGSAATAEENAELQEQLEELQEQLESLQEASEDAEESDEEVVEESTEEVVEESTEEVVEESTEEVVEESTEEVVEESSEEVVEESSEEVVEESTEEVVEESTEEVANEPAAELSADWTTYAFSVNGKTLTLPCSYQELSEATGLQMKSSNAKSYLEAGYYTNVNLYTAEEDLGLYIDILNDSDEDQVYTDCLVIGISQTEYQALDQGASMITFAAGLQVGMEMTTEDVEAIFGEPQDTYEYVSDDSDYTSDEWTYAEDPEWTTHNSMDIYIVNGVVDQISLDRLYYDE